MPELTLYLLGPPRLELDGQAVHLGRHKAVALLAYLALTHQPHSRDALATLLWPDLDQSAARGQLRRTLSLLNRALGGEWLAVDRETAAWAPDAQAWIDADHLRERLAGCAAHGHAAQETCPQCIPLLAEAVDLYRDGFLTGFTLPDCPAFDEWQFFETEGLRDQAADALQRLARWHGAREEYDAAIPYARRWLALDPLHEPAHCELMALYARSGQRAAALRQYAECERLLAEELALTPSAETTALHEAIRTRQELPIWDDAAEGAPPEPSAPRQHNLPVQLTPFVGRERELIELDGLLSPAAETRLVTVMGPGGMGKTRLALEAASRQIDRYARGVFFVSLAPLDAVESIVPTVAQAFGFTFYGEGEPKAQLLNYLRHKQMLLILDNVEHLLSPLSVPPDRGEDKAGTELVTDILHNAPGIHVLATSRARLNVRGESCFPVEGMDVPTLTPSAPLRQAPLHCVRDRQGGLLRTSPGPSSAFGRGELDNAAQYSAVKLFVDSARRARPDFELTAENVADVVRICHLVEGMPLGVLLAAAWVKMLSAAEIAAEIESQMTGLDFLESDQRDVPERHTSVRAVFDHSWRLLAKREQTLFATLSVFRGGFTRQAAQQVAGASLRQLMALADKSLLHRTPGGRSLGK